MTRLLMPRNEAESIYFPSGLRRVRTGNRDFPSRSLSLSLSLEQSNRHLIPRRKMDYQQRSPPPLPALPLSCPIFDPPAILRQSCAETSPRSRKSATPCWIHSRNGNCSAQRAGLRARSFSFSLSPHRDVRCQVPFPPRDHHHRRTICGVTRGGGSAV